MYLFMGNTVKKNYAVIKYYILLFPWYLIHLTYFIFYAYYENREIEMLISVPLVPLKIDYMKLRSVNFYSVFILFYCWEILGIYIYIYGTIRRKLKPG